MMSALRCPIINDVASDYELRFPKNPEIGPVPHGFRPQQEKYWGDKLAPLTLPASLDVPGGFELCVKEVEQEGWQTVLVDKSAYLIQAVDTTTWLRFKDDVVIRVSQPAGAPVQVDMRSRSRIGKGDLGKNAARIIDFFDSVRKSASA